MGNDKDVQKLIDICFEMVLTVKGSSFAKDMSRDDLANWVRENLKKMGFETEPIGLSWGVLKK